MTDDQSTDDKIQERSEAWASKLDDTERTEDASNAADTEDTMDATDTQDTSHTERTSNTQETTEWDVESIRESWNPNSIRLPDSIQEPFDSEYKRLDWQLEDTDVDVDFRKDRHYKPLVIALGIQAVREQDTDEIADAIEAMVAGDLLDD